MEVVGILRHEKVGVFFSANHMAVFANH